MEEGVAAAILRVVRGLELKGVHEFLLPGAVKG